MSRLTLAVLFLLVSLGFAEEGSLSEAAQMQKMFDICEEQWESVELPILWESAYALGKMGRFDDSCACFEKYAIRSPATVKVWALLSELKARMGETTLSRERATVAARIPGESPAAAEGHFLIANTYMSENLFGVAQRSFERAIRLDPRHVNSMVNLGVVLGMSHDYAKAIPVYRRALELEPNIMPARHNLGSALHTIKKFGEAMHVLEALLKDEPKCFECLLSLGHTLSEVQKLERSKLMYKTALDLRPLDSDALLNYYHTKQQVLDWDEREDLFQRLVKVTEAQLAQRHLTTVTLYYSILSPYDQEQMLGIAESHATKAYDKVKWMIPLLPATFGLRLEPPLSRLRVGYIMADFRHHVTAHLLQTVFVRHNPDKFEIFCYALNEDDGSLFRRRIRDSVDSEHFREAHKKTDDQVATIVNNDLLSILIDTDYYKARLSVLALRPAPVQVNFLAHPGTSGADYVDHIVADRVVAPPDNALFFSESILIMSHHYQVNDHQTSYPVNHALSIAEIRNKEGLPLDAVVFCNFNGLYKIEPAAFDVWVRILKRVDGSVLWLVSDNEESNNNLLRQAESRGVDHSRIVLAGRADFAEHIARVSAADVFLDSFTYNAHTTAVDSLWGGLPVVTMPGHNMNMRLASGALSSFGPASETCVRTVEEYEEVAVVVVSASGRKRIQARLHAHWRLDGVEQGGLSREGLASRPLFDTEGWVEDLEGGLAMMADLSASGVGRGETEAQYYSGGGAGGKGRLHHLIRAHRREWGPASKLF